MGDKVQVDSILQQIKHFYCAYQLTKSIDTFIWIYAAPAHCTAAVQSEAVGYCFLCYCFIL